MYDLSHRTSDYELIDHPELEKPVLRDALHQIAIMNRMLNVHGPALRAIRNVIEPQTRRFSLLDTGCGCGDGLRRIARWAGQRGLEAQLFGIDPQPAAVEIARAKCQPWPAIRICARDLFDVPEEQRFDVVYGASVLHHYPGLRAAAALRKMHALARRAVIINDLHRHVLAYRGIELLTSLFSRSYVTRYDGPLSVARGFHKRELLALCQAAGIPNAQVQWRFAFRWLMVIRKQQS